MKQDNSFEGKLDLVIEQLGLSRKRKTLVDMLKQSMRIRTVEESEIVIMTGESKLGGLPDLPVGKDWPRTRAGKPMAFVAQLNFTELPDFAGTMLLPSRGILFFFYEPSQGDWGTAPEVSDRWTTFLIDNPQANLRKTVPPEDLAPEFRFSSCKVKFSKELTLPPLDSFEFEAMKLGDEFQEDYFDLLNALSSIQGGTDEEPVHRLFGFPDQIRRNVGLDAEMGRTGLYEGSGPFMSDAQSLKVEREARKWLVLLQVDSDPLSEMTWGNYGRLYFLIRGEDLRAFDFSRAWLVRQEFREKPEEPQFEEAPEETEDE
jgi:uncharacterized protein YwqG